MKLLKILAGVIVAIVVLALVGYFVAFRVATQRYEHRWTAHDAAFPIPFPLDSSNVAATGAANEPAANASVDAAATAHAVAHGAQLIKSRLGCAGCHGADFGGSVLIDVPAVGYWAAPNLTLGQGGVTSGFSAHDWDLAVRHGIRHTGQSSSMPSGEFIDLADHDLSDVIAYIRSLPPVDRRIKPVRLGPVFTLLTASDPKMLPAFGIDHQKPHRVEPPAEAPTVELGDYIAQNCRGCHNPKMSGGKLPGDPNMPIVANLTPDATGIKGWTQADFVHAIRDGKRPDGTAINKAMPWEQYRNMSDVELQAVWAYLQTLPPLPKGKQQ